MEIKTREELMKKPSYKYYNDFSMHLNKKWVAVEDVLKSIDFYTEAEDARSLYDILDKLTKSLKRGEE